VAVVHQGLIRGCPHPIERLDDRFICEMLCVNSKMRNRSLFQVKHKQPNKQTDSSLERGTHFRLLFTDKKTFISLVHREPYIVSACE
jgi:hypothetical protein